MPFNEGPITIEEIKSLPLWGRVAFAAACARRLASQVDWNKEPHAEIVQEATVAAIRVAEMWAISPPHHATDAARAAAKAADAAYAADANISRAAAKAAAAAYEAADAAKAAVEATRAAADAARAAGDDDAYEAYETKATRVAAVAAAYTIAAAAAAHAADAAAKAADADYAAAAASAERHWQRQVINELRIVMKDRKFAGAVPGSWFLRDLTRLPEANTDSENADLRLGGAIRNRYQLLESNSAEPSSPQPAQRSRWAAFLRGVENVLNIFAAPQFDYGKKPAGSSIDRAWRNTCRAFKTTINKFPPQSQE